MWSRFALYAVTIAALVFALKELLAFVPLQKSLNPIVFNDSALLQANQDRLSIGTEALRPNAQLQNTLASYVKNGQMVNHDLNDLFSHLEHFHPRAHRLSANLIYGREMNDLLAELQTWPDLVDGEHTDFAAWVYYDPANRALACVSVLARELPQLELPVQAVNETEEAWYDECRICGQGHGVSFRKQAQNTLIISCPHCENAYSLIASDTGGNWRRANQFFHEEAFLPPEIPVGNGSRVLEMMRIWRTVAEQCRYVPDAERIQGGDSWQFPSETWERRAGDCEDTSILLADILIARGFDARVALGEHDGGGHAWVVVRLDGEDYLLESTWEDVDQIRLPLTVADTGIEYTPNYLVDREAVYFLRFDGWTADYWSEDNWLRVPNRDSVQQAVNADRIGD